MKIIPKNKKNKDLSSVYSCEDLEKIKERAYYIWEQKGRPADSTFNDWFEAERELKKEGFLR